MRRLISRFLTDTQKASLKKYLNYPTPYEFKQSYFISNQSVELNFNEKTRISFGARGNVPLYETIYEFFDDDCYGLRLLKQLNSEFELIYDLGCNDGIFSVYANLMFPSCKIEAYEPSAANYDDDKNNLDQLIQRNIVSLKKAAVGAKDGTIELKIGSLGVDSSTQRLPKPHDDVEKVSVVSLKKALAHNKGKKAILKIDIEGAEYEIFESLTSADLEDVVFIALELHDIGPSQSMQSFKIMLGQLGFEFEVKKDSWGRHGLELLWGRRVVA